MKEQKNWTNFLEVGKLYQSRSNCFCFDIIDDPLCADMSMPHIIISNHSVLAGDIFIVLSSVTIEKSYNINLRQEYRTYTKILLKNKITFISASDNYFKKLSQ